MKKFMRILGIVAAIAGIIVAIVLICSAKNTVIPDKHVYVSSSSRAYYLPWEDNTGAQYLGGDAYNYIVEASLKAGYYSGMVTEKAVTYVGGILLLFISMFFLLGSVYSLQESLNADKQLSALKEIVKNTGCERTVQQAGIDVSADATETILHENETDDNTVEEEQSETTV